MSHPISRRGLLAGTGSALTALLAGCGTLPFVGNGDDSIDSDEWPMAAHDPQNTNRTTATLPDEPTEQWRASVGGRTPVVADGTVYVLSPDNDGGFGDSPPSTVYALDAGTGDEEWTEPLPDSRELRSRPAVGDGSVVYGTVVDSGRMETPDTWQGTLHAREMDEANERWQVDLAPNATWISSTVVDDTVLAAGPRDDRVGWVGTFETASGDQQWEEELDIWTYGPPATDGDLVVALTVSGNVFAFDFETGERRWTHFDNPAKAVFRPLVPPALGEERIFIHRYDTTVPETTLHALTHDGEEDWQCTVPEHPPRTGSPLFTLGLTQELVLCLTVEPAGYSDPPKTTYLTAFDCASGEEQWRYTVSSTGSYNVSQLTLTEESALFAVNDRLHAVSLDGKKRWERPTDYVTYEKPIVADDRLYLNVAAEDDEGASLAAFE